MNRFLVVFFLLYFYVSAMGQERTSLKSSFQQHYEKAFSYKKAMLYSDCIRELERCIGIASKSHDDISRMTATIELAEVLRSTFQYDEGLKLLESLKNTSKYPKLHVQKLGRQAALLHERTSDNLDSTHRLVYLYLNEAIKLAKQNKFASEEAGLRNELGYLLFRAGKQKEGLAQTIQAARLFEQLGDDEHYTHVLTKILEDYIWFGDWKKADSISAIALKKFNEKKWPAIGIELYGALGNQAVTQKDRLAELNWRLKAINCDLQLNEAVHTERLASFEVLHKTQRLKDNVAFQNATLKEKEQQMKNLILYLVILLLLIAGTIFLFIRERRLKVKMNELNGELNQANNKYQMLLVESNHRIKNNLQMITSMVEYTSMDIDQLNQKLFKKVSVKIQAISALHKHLYLDTHNGYVNLGTYFREIVALYTELSPTNFQLEDGVDDVLIQSERIVYFGLLFNEMLANSIEHSKIDHLHIALTAKRKNNSCIFIYRDESTRKADLKEGTGTKLISQLIERIGGSNYLFNPETGQYKFEFDATS